MRFDGTENKSKVENKERTLLCKSVIDSMDQIEVRKVQNESNRFYKEAQKR